MNKERILKYLSGMMSPEEISRFESELKISASLNAELENIRTRLKSLNPDTEESKGHTYFANLIPRMRERIEHKKSKRYSVLKYAVPVFLAALIYILIPFNGEQPFEEQIKNLNDSVQAELLNYLDEPVEMTENAEVLELAIGNELKLDEVNQLDAGYVNTSDLLDNLSAEEINNIYNSMISKKIL